MYHASELQFNGPLVPAGFCLSGLRSAVKMTGRWVDPLAVLRRVMASQPSLGRGTLDRGVSFARRVFTFAGVYGVLVLAPQYFMEAKLGRDFPPPITHPEQYYGFIGVALAWQVLFLIMARDPARYRLVMIPAILEKLAFGVPAVVLYLQGRLSPVILGPGVIDLILAVLFVLSFRATAEPGRPGAVPAGASVHGA